MGVGVGVGIGVGLGVLVGVIWGTAEDVVSSITIIVSSVSAESSGS